MRKLLKRSILMVLKKFGKNYIYRELSGHKFIIYFTNFVHRRAIIKFPNREEEFHAELCNRMCEVDLLFDIGANIGLYVLEFSRFTNLKIVCVEPDEVNYQVLCQNIISNNLHERHVCLKAVVGDKTERVSARIHDSGSGNAMVDVVLSDGHTMDMFNIEDLISEHNVNLLECACLIDVEGYEALIFNKNTRIPNTVKYIAIEIHQKQMRKYNKSVMQLIDEITGLGYRLDWLRVPEKGIDQHGQTHAIFSRLV